MHACPPPSLSPCPTRTSPLPLFSAWACRLGRGTPPPSGAGPPSSQVTRITLSPALASPCRGRCATNLSSCQCIAARAGVRTAAEPPFRLFPTPSSPPAIPSAGPALASSLGACTPGLPVLVPDAPALTPAAALALPDDLAPSPCPGAPFRSLDPLSDPPSPGPEAWGNVMFVFPRRLVVGDVSVIQPAAASFARGAARTPRFAAAAQGASNRRTYRQVCSASLFVPMLVEFFGRLRALALTLLGHFDDQTVQAGGPGLSRAAFMSESLRELGAALCRGNASLGRSGLYALTQASGRALFRGLPYPLAEVV
jgi:hypothetical protein